VEGGETVKPFVDELRSGSLAIDEGGGESDSFSGEEAFF